MHEADKVFAGSIPENYDRHLVPMLFAPYAADLARRVLALSPRAILETAAGTGAVTRTLAPQLGADTTYIASDLNQPMIDHAIATQAPGSRVTWRQTDALALPFADASFDLLCCQFGVMFFPDRIKGYGEARRVLKSGGHFLFSAWDRIEENEIAALTTKVLAQIFPKDPPAFMARTPHGYHDKAVIHRDLEKAGFSQITIETLAEQSRAPSARIAALAYCQGSFLRSEIEARGKDMLEPATSAVEAALIDKFGKGPISAKIQAHVVSAVA